MVVALEVGGCEVCVLGYHGYAWGSRRAGGHCSYELRESGEAESQGVDAAGNSTESRDRCFS